MRLQAALSRGLLPDDETLKQLVLDPELPLAGRDIATLRWPEEPLRFVLTSKRPASWHLAQVITSGQGSPQGLHFP